MSKVSSVCKTLLLLLLLFTYSVKTASVAIASYCGAGDGSYS